MATNKLADTYEVNGTTKEEFNEILDDLAASTVCHKIKRLDEFSFASIYPRRNDDRLLVSVMNFKHLPSRIGEYQIVSRKLKIPDEIKNDEKFEHLLKETKEAGFFLRIREDGVVHSHFVSPKILTSKLSALGLGGDYFAKPIIERDWLIMRALADATAKGSGVSLIIRQDGDFRKLFSIQTGKYCYVNQTVINDIIDAIEKTKAMGTPKFARWKVSNYLTQVVIDFPDKADELQSMYGISGLMPCMIIETSDTGDSSVICRGAFRAGDSYTVVSEVSRKHIGNFRTDNFVSVVEKTIFAEYAKLPEALCNSVMTPIGNGEDLETVDGQTRNAEYINAAIDEAAKYIRLVDCIGKKAKNEVLRQLKDEFDASVQYTGYDIAMAFIKLPQRISGISKSALRLLEKATSKAAYVNYSSAKPSVVTI